MNHTPDSLQFAIAAELGDTAIVDRVLASNPTIVSTLTDDERFKLAAAAERNNISGVRLMLRAGWPADARRDGQPSPLHWAGLSGNAAMARVLLEHGAPIDAVELQFKGTPLDWALYGSVHGWHKSTGDYAGTAPLCSTLALQCRMSIRSTPRTPSSRCCGSEAASASRSAPFRSDERDDAGVFEHAVEQILEAQILVRGVLIVVVIDDRQDDHRRLERAHDHVERETSAEDREGNDGSAHGAFDRRVTARASGRRATHASPRIPLPTSPSPRARAPCARRASARGRR